MANNLLERKQFFSGETFEDPFKESNALLKEQILFENCTFKSICSFRSLMGNGRLLFYHCKFERDFSLEECELLTIDITNCTFLRNCYITDVNCKGVLILKDIKVNEVNIKGRCKTLQVDRSTIKNLSLKDINNKYSVVESNLGFYEGNKIDKVNIKTISTYSNLNFSGGEYDSIYLEGEFKGNILFKGSVSAEYLFLESSTFYKRISITEGFFNHINLSRSHFKGLIMINDYDLLEKKRRNLEIDGILIHSNLFDEDIIIDLLKIKSLSISNNNIKQLLRFSSFQNEEIHTLEMNLDIAGTNQGNISISSSYANIDIGGLNYGSISFKNMTISTLYIDEFHNKGILSFLNVECVGFFTIQDSVIGDTEFLNFNINNFEEIVFANSNISNINFSQYPKKILSNSSNPQIGYGIQDKSKREENLKNIYNQLKIIAKKNGNVDISSRYRSLEYNYLLKEKKIGYDKLLLILNKISNNHGKSWIRGIFFTIVISYVFYNIYMILMDVKFDLDDNLKDFVVFISSFPKLSLDKYSEFNNIWNVSLIIWLSRIFISYGIYQTIAAFRKYGKI